jgi:hypothetical protein
VTTGSAHSDLGGCDSRTRGRAGTLAADRFHPDDGGYVGIAAVFGEVVGA